MECQSQILFNDIYPFVTLSAERTGSGSLSHRLSPSSFISHKSVVADPATRGSGRSRGGAWGAQANLYFWLAPTRGPKSQKQFFGRLPPPLLRPLSKGLDDRPPPPALSQSLDPALRGEGRIAG